MTEELDDPFAGTDEAIQDGTQGESSEPGDADEKATQRERYIAELKGRVGHLNAENQKMAERLAALEGRVDEQRSMFGKPAEEAVPADPWKLDDETLETYRNDPAKILEFSRERQDELVFKIQKVFEMQQDIHRNEIAALKGELKKFDPEMAKFKPQIDALVAKNPKLKDLGEEALVEIVKATAPAESAEPEGWRGAPGQGQVPRAATGKYTKEQAKKDYDFFLALTENPEKAKKLVERKRKETEGVQS